MSPSHMTRGRAFGSPRKAGMTAVVVVIFLTSCGPAGPAPVMQFGTHLDSESGAVIARSGDTLWSISNRYRLPLRDIIDINGLTPPYHLSSGQRIKLPPPAEYKVRPDDTLNGVARLFHVPVSQVAQLNNLSSPYRLHTGQVLRLPSRQKDVAPPVSVQIVQDTHVKNIEAVESEVLSQPTSAIQISQNAPQKNSVMPKVEPASMPKLQQVAIVKPAVRAGYIWPLQGRVVSGYGAKKDGLYNDGINIAAPKGTPVAAVADGSVVYVGDDLESYGNLVLIRHAGGVVTAYAHLSSVAVRQGMKVKKGQAIGAVGATGSVDTAQLHFEVRRGRETLDPKEYLG